ncbi:MAG: hypothetical protein RLZZ522_1634 [Verrucomicrobiota bacterium]
MGQAPPVRVPLPLAIVVAIAFTLGLWWGLARHFDFLTPPSAERLAIIRQLAETALPRAEVPLPSQAPEHSPVDSTPPRRIQTRPAETSAEIAKRNPSLDTYADRSAKGSRHLIELGTLVEASGDRQRGLLAWERVLDSTKAPATHLSAALAAVKRLRPLVPAWSASHAPFPVVLHLDTSARFEEMLTPIAAELAAELEQASAGILQVSAAVTTGRNSSTKTAKPIKPSRSTRSSRSTKTPATPIVLWLSGPAEVPAVETLSFTVAKPENLHPDLLRNLFKATCKQLADHDEFTPPAVPPKTEAPLEALSFRITRLRWLQLGQALNPPPTPPPCAQERTAHRAKTRRLPANSDKCCQPMPFDGPPPACDS